MKIDLNTTEFSFRRLPKSPREGHAQVFQGDVLVGDVWCEKTRLFERGIPTNKTGMRWYGKRPDQARGVGRGRSALRVGAGFDSRSTAVMAMIAKE